MLRNYLTVALRNLSRHRGYTAINAAGLAIGIACCLVIFAFVRDELSFDRFHEDADRVYRVVYSTSDDGQPTNANSSFSVGPELVDNVPEIIEAVRFVKMGWGEERVFVRGDQRFYEQAFFFADPSVFNVFTFPLLNGDADQALTEPHTLVLTRETARKYFGGDDPLGRTIAVDAFNDGDFVDYTVTGVFQDIPANSHSSIFCCPMQAFPDRHEDWGWIPYSLYAQLAENADPRAIESRVAALLDEHMEHERYFEILLQPLVNIHLHSDLRAELQPNGSIGYIYTFSAIAVFILLLACINFMNLATARSARRAREVGMRK